LNRLIYKRDPIGVYLIKMARKTFNNNEKIKAIIQRAINIVKGVEEPYRLKAFEVVLSKLWPASLEERKEREKKPKKPEGMNLEAKIEDFADKCNVSVEQLTNIYDFQKDKPLLIVPLQGNHRERQVFASRYLLVAYSEIYGQKWVNLRQPLSEQGVRSLQNLAENLKKHREIFRSRGRGKAMEYKLVDAAKRETFDMIRALATGQSQE